MNNSSVFSIGIQNEKSLHSEIKKLYFQNNDLLEKKIDNYIIDIVRDNLLIEIQTNNFSAIKKKLTKLVENHKILLVYPIIEEKYIVIQTKDFKNINRRKSPKKGKIIDIFDELIRFPELINHENFSLEILLVSIEEIQIKDGKGSWRRKGYSIFDRKLLQVNKKITINNKFELINLIPEINGETFTNKNLAEKLNISRFKASKITYCLKKIGIISVVSKKINEQIFKINY